MKKFGKYLVLFLTFEMLTSFMGCKPEVHTHTFADSWTSDAEYHWHEATCEHAEEVADMAVHTWGYGVVTKEATEEEEGELLFTCYVCKKTKTEVIEKLEHSHKYASDWESDEEYHWHPATCGHTEEVADMASHSWGYGVVTKEATEEEEGELLFTCDICKKTKTVVIEKLGHSHKFASDWESNEEYHWYPTTCGHIEVVAHMARHTWGYGVVTKEATEEEEGELLFTCDICKKTKTEVIKKLEHIHKYSTDWESDEEFHWHAAICGHNEKSCEETHIEDKGTITITPTCITKGERTYKCKTCNAVLKTEEIPELYSSPVDAETGNAPNSWSTKYIYFGVFPKTVLATDSTVTVDESFCVEMGANIYYKGNDGNYYAKVIANPNTREFYSDGSEVESGTVRYFKVEPIKWKILAREYNESRKVLLLAEDILTGSVPYYVSETNLQRIIDFKDVNSNNYEYSIIRAYLNGLDYYENDGNHHSTVKKTDYTGNGFLQTAFVSSARLLIADTEIDNNVKTIDKVFLLSASEISTYVTSNTSTYCRDLIRKPTDYAKANYVEDCSSLYDNYGGDWWLRTPENNKIYEARYVNYKGDDRVHEVVGKLFGIVPALSISLP